MIKIKKSEAPKCLDLLPFASTYDDLRGDCRKEVQQSLANEQHGLCAYCQYKFRSTVFIEHYVPQSVDATKQLDYHNFLGCCSGKYPFKNRTRSNKIEFCHKQRGNELLSINPQNQADIDTIFYDDDFRICSTNVTFQREFDEVLNLNFDDICIDRAIQYEEEIQQFIIIAIELELSKIELYEKAIKTIQVNYPEFSGMLIYKFEKQLEFYQNLS